MEVSMSSNEEREKHSQRRKRNFIAKMLREKKMFSPKVINSKKTEYKRERINPRNMESYNDDENE